LLVKQGMSVTNQLVRTLRTCTKAIMIMVTITDAIAKHSESLNT